MGQQIPRPLQCGPCERNKEKSSSGKWPFWDFVAEFAFLHRRQGVVIEDWRD